MFTYSKNRTLNAQWVIVSVTEEIMARVDKWIEDSNNHNMGNVVFIRYTFDEVENYTNEA